MPVHKVVSIGRPTAPQYLRHWHEVCPSGGTSVGRKGDPMAQADTHDLPVNTQPHPLNWAAAIWASVISGLVFAALEMVLVPIFDHMSPWAPLHLIGAIGLGPDALSPANTFDLKIVSAAVAIHMALAILYGVILALIIERLDTGWAVVVGALYGLAL